MIIFKHLGCNHLDAFTNDPKCAVCISRKALATREYCRERAMRPGQRPRVEYYVNAGPLDQEIMRTLNQKRRWHKVKWYHQPRYINLTKKVLVLALFVVLAFNIQYILLFLRGN